MRGSSPAGEAMINIDNATLILKLLTQVLGLFTIGAGIGTYGYIKQKNKFIKQYNLDWEAYEKNIRNTE